MGQVARRVTGVGFTALVTGLRHRVFRGREELRGVHAAGRQRFAGVVHGGGYCTDVSFPSHVVDGTRVYAPRNEADVRVASVGGTGPGWDVDCSPTRARGHGGPLRGQFEVRGLPRRVERPVAHRGRGRQGGEPRRAPSAGRTSWTATVLRLLRRDNARAPPCGRVGRHAHRPAVRLRPRHHALRRVRHRDRARHRFPSAQREPTLLNYPTLLNHPSLAVTLRTDLW